MGKMGDWGLGTRERLLQRPPFFSFLRPDRLIFDSKSHGNDVIRRDFVIVREDFKKALHRFTHEFQGSVNIPLLE